MCTTKPVVVPASDTSPATRPWHSVRETRYSRFGPGVSTSSTLATTNSRKLSSDGIGHRDGGAGALAIARRPAPR